MTEKFQIYSKVGCIYCEKLATLMDQHNIPYNKLTLGEEYTTEEFLEKFGHSTFPRVLLGEELIGGMKETAQYLVKNKYV
jgi:glutaredoxin